MTASRAVNYIANELLAFTIGISVFWAYGVLMVGLLAVSPAVLAFAAGQGGGGVCLVPGNNHRANERYGLDGDETSGLVSGSILHASPITISCLCER